MLSLRKVYVSFGLLALGTVMAHAASFYGFSKLTLTESNGANGVNVVSRQLSVDSYSDLGSSATATASAAALTTEVRGSTLPSPTTASAVSYTSLIFKNTNSYATTLTLHYTYDYQMVVDAADTEYAEVTKNLGFVGSFTGGNGFSYTISAPPHNEHSGTIEGTLTAYFLAGQSKGLQINIGNDGYAAVPEPATFAVLGIGLVGIAASRRRR